MADPEITIIKSKAWDKSRYAHPIRVVLAEHRSFKRFATYLQIDYGSYTLLTKGHHYIDMNDAENDYISRRL